MRCFFLFSLFVFVCFFFFSMLILSSELSQDPKESADCKVKCNRWEIGFVHKGER